MTAIEMLYLDTSIVVSLLVLEPETARLKRWMSSKTGESIVVSDWSVTEVSSALSAKVRIKAITDDERAKAKQIFQGWLSINFEKLPVQNSHFNMAALFCDAYTTGLRAADALHMAIAYDCGATLVSRDQQMIAAAEALGHHCILL